MADPLTSRTRSIRDSRLPRRTYQSAIHRIYEWRWIHDRFVPGPSLTGRPIISFLLARTTDESRSQVIKDMRRSPGLALCWALSRTVFSVSFLKGASQAESLAAHLRAHGRCSEVRALAVDGTESGVSIYFDFEGEWNRYGGITGVQGYPHGLHDRARGSDAEERVLPSSRVLRVTRDMIIRPLAQEQEAAGAPASRSRWYLRFVEQSMIRHGWVEARAFFDPMAVAKTLTDFAGGVTFVHGNLRTGIRSESLKRQLLEGAGVHPFLLASDERSALLGFLSAGPGTRLAPAPTPRETVRSVIERNLEPFVVIREGLDSGERIVSHRYDAVLAGPTRVGR